MSLLLILIGWGTTPPADAAVPVVDDPAFIATAGQYQSGIDDYDVLLLREQAYGATGVNLSGFGSMDPLVTVNNNASWGTHPFVQSILVRIYDGGLGDISGDTVQGKITLHVPPGSDAQILGVLTDTSDGQRVIIDGTDSLFESNLGAISVLQGASSRGFEGRFTKKGAPRTTWDLVEIDASRQSLKFRLGAAAGSDDFRVIVSYGTGLADFPAGVSFDVDFNTPSPLGVQLAGVDYGEVTGLRSIPLTSTTSPVRIAQTTIPDNQYVGQTRGRDVVVNLGGDNDNNGIYFFAVHNRISDGVVGTPDFYVYLFDADNDAPSTGSIKSDDGNGGIGDIGGDTIFEYRLYGGDLASVNDDIQNPLPTDPNQGNPASYAGATLIDINPDCAGDTLITNTDGSRVFRSINQSCASPDNKTLRTDRESGILVDQKWVAIGVDMDATPGDKDTDGTPIDPQMTSLFGTAIQVYKLVVDGTLGIEPGGDTAKDTNSYQVDISTVPDRNARMTVPVPDMDRHIGDCRSIKPIYDCVVPYAFEMTYSGRPQAAQLPTETLIYVPTQTSVHSLDIQTLDLDECWFSNRLGRPVTSRLYKPVDATWFEDVATLEGDDQVDSLRTRYMWTSLNGGASGERDACPDSRDGLSGVGFDTTANEDALWTLQIDPGKENNPFSLRGRIDGFDLAMIPLAPGTVADSDRDGIPDNVDNCPAVANPGQEDLGEINNGGIADGIGDACDNCPAVNNPGQEDQDGDGIGDACDNCLASNNPLQEDIDADTIGDVCDNCTDVANTNQADFDQDTVGDSCDNCSGLGGMICYNANCANPDQSDFDQDTIGDVCDASCGPLADPDGDLVWTCQDNCPNDANPSQTDTDCDGVGDACDNCPGTLYPGQCGLLNPDYNPDQADTELVSGLPNPDGVGDACDICPDSVDPRSVDTCIPGDGILEQPDNDCDGIGNACDPCPDVPGVVCGGGCGNNEAEVEIHPETHKKGNQGNTVLVEIEFEEGSCHEATDIDLSGGNKIYMTFPKPVPAACTNPPYNIDANDPKLAHIAGTERFADGHKLHVKFDRPTIDACVDPGEHVLLTITGTLNDGHEFSGSDDLRVCAAGGNPCPDNH